MTDQFAKLDERVDRVGLFLEETRKDLMDLTDWASEIEAMVNKLAGFKPAVKRFGWRSA